MARKDVLQERLSRLAAVRAAPTMPEAVTLLRETLAKGPGLAVAKAAEIVADAACDMAADGKRAEEAEAWAVSFFSDLLAAYARCCNEPARHDKGAFGKIALAAALDRLEYPDAAPFERGVAYVQLEPSAGGPVDKAAPLRARALAALIRLRHPERLMRLADLLWDPWPEARLGAVHAAAFDGSEAAEALLRAKALAGERGADGRLAPDGGAEIVGAAFAGLLSLGAKRHIPFVARFLDDAKQPEPLRDQAAMALGESRHPEGLRCLAAAWAETVDEEEKQRLVFGAALNGSAEALAALAGWMRAAGEEERRRIRETARDVLGANNPRFARLEEIAGMDASNMTKNRGNADS